MQREQPAEPAEMEISTSVSENDSKSVGQATICCKGDYIVDECERGVACTGAGRSCKVCVYSHTDASNEKHCNTCQDKSTFLLVCDESGKFVRQDCSSLDNMKTYCRLNSNQPYKAYCALKAGMHLCRAYGAFEAHYWQRQYVRLVFYSVFGAISVGVKIF